MYRLLFVAFFLISLKIGNCQSPPYSVKFFDQKIDHFNVVSYGDKTFKQRYMIKDSWWKPGQGPIFLYTGNEGPITAFWDATGFMFDIAPDFEALVVFVEHIYLWVEHLKGVPKGMMWPAKVISVVSTSDDYLVYIKSDNAEARPCDKKQASEIACMSAETSIAAI